MQKILPAEVCAALKVQNICRRMDLLVLYEVFVAQNFSFSEAGYRLYRLFFVFTKNPKNALIRAVLKTQN